MLIYPLLILLCYNIGITHARDRTSELENIAFEKLTEQSSTGWDGPSSLAVDGNTSGNYRDKSITHTLDDTNP